MANLRNVIYKSYGRSTKTTAQKLESRLKRYDKFSLLGNEKKTDKLTKKLDKMATRFEKALARHNKHIIPGKTDNNLNAHYRRAQKLQGYLDQIYSRLRPENPLANPGQGVSMGSARPNREGRLATIYLGGGNDLLGLGARGNRDNAPGQSSDGPPPAHLVPPSVTNGPASTFLQRLYGTDTDAGSSLTGRLYRARLL